MPFNDDLLNVIGNALNDPSSYTGNKCSKCGSPLQKMPNGKELCSNYPSCPNSLYS